MASYGVIGYYMNCDDAICKYCAGEMPHDEASDPDFWPAPIWPNTESDTPTHCCKCEDLIPHALTSDGLAYVREHVEANTGRAEILAQWKAEYLPDAD